MSLIPPTNPPAKTKFLSNRKSKVLLLAFSCLSVLLIAEFALRSIGRHPWRVAVLGHSAIHEPHPMLGWRQKSDTVLLLPPLHPLGSDVQYSFLAGGLRKSSRDQTNARDGRPKLILLGCSFTMGYGISDDETLGWKLQERIPAVEVLNHAVGAYGTYQSLLKLEEVLPDLKQKQPQVVLYGFADFHEDRNVASAAWVRMLTWYSGGWVQVPYVQVQEGGGLSRGIERYPSWPLRERSALITLMADTSFNFQTKHRESKKEETTEQTILEMSNLCEKNGTRFCVTLLSLSKEKKSHYLEFFKSHHIEVIDCAFPIPEERRVKGDGHPNGKQTALWAEHIEKTLYPERVVDPKETGTR